MYIILAKHKTKFLSVLRKLITSRIVLDDLDTWKNPIEDDEFWKNPISLKYIFLLSRYLANSFPWYVLLRFEFYRKSWAACRGILLRFEKF